MLWLYLTEVNTQIILYDRAIYRIIPPQHSSHYFLAAAIYLCVTGMDLPAATGVAFFGASILSTPSADRFDASFSASMCVGMEPWSSSFSSCLASIVSTLSDTFTVNSSGLN